jgi:hypothetical protein
MTVFSRPEACKDCPFKDGVPKEALEPGDPCTMLCYESACLRGDADTDLMCEGWRRDAKDNRDRRHI